MPANPASRGDRLPGRRQPHRLHRRGPGPPVRRRRARRVRGRRAQRHLRRRGLRAAGVVGAARRGPAQGPGAARRVLGGQLRRLDDGRRGQRLDGVGEHPAGPRHGAGRQPVRPAGRRAADHFRDLLTRRVDFDAIELDSAGEHPLLADRRRRRPVRPVPRLPQPPRPDHRRHGPGVRRHPHGVPDRAHRRRRLLGRPVLPEPPGARAARDRARRAVGDPDQPDRAGRPSPARSWTSPTGATSSRATSPSTRSCTSSS